MTIEKGQPWGGPAVDPEPALVADGDVELAALAAAEVAAGAQAVVRPVAGDLLATLGVDGVRPAGERHDYPVDLGMAYLRSEHGQPEQGPFPFVAHLVVGMAGRGGAAALLDPIGALLAWLLRHGPDISVAVMNAAWLGDLRLGPRAHPNDGKLDITEGQVGFRERREALKRARSGSHLPHPALRTTRAAEWQADFDHARQVRIDGVDRGRFCAVRVELMPDALIVVA